MVSLIVPAAGKSTRFPNMRPKWMLTHPDGQLMVTAALKGLDLSEVSCIYLTVLQEHLDAYATPEGIERVFKDAQLGVPLKLLALDQSTSSQPETVAKTIEHQGIQGPIFVKDVDNFFRMKIEAENSVAVGDLNTAGFIDASNKSYVMYGDNGRVTNIVEKQVISSHFCVGGYSFADAADFLQHFARQLTTPRLFVSHIIFQMVLEGAGFVVREVTAYEDWGTLPAWQRYRSKFVTLFVDVDGVLVKNSGQYFDPMWGTTGKLEKNVVVLNSLYASGKATIILISTRTEAFAKVTEAQLATLGIKYHRILFGLPHTRRIIINDYSRTNPYKSCDAINLARDTDTLEELLSDLLNSP